MKKIVKKVFQFIGILLFILAGLYLTHLSLNLNDPHLNDLDVIDLTVKSAMYFLILGIAMISFSLFYSELSAMAKSLAATVLLGLAALPGYTIGVEPLIIGCSPCSAFEMHWLSNLVGLLIFVLSIGGLFLLWLPFLKRKM
ncbi:hypothetical protein K1720_09220 [Thermococcus argininiproducens]|uniref:Uncharacterized protein n=1 Tax=Thermococcus argininiproducens TaxID=2866384 RepID=A0A9E7SD18_9EURY|nr:hypothetical protein [Thermococcus argininiproducens]USG99667.1 hypothetical protein K1720_09220 [Thermococcus argininiproducens]